jgi:AraC-like DNA-binding protein
MLIVDAPCALLWPAAMILWGPGFKAAEHQHHCVQLLMALNGTLRVRRASSERWIDCAAVLVRPDARHEIDATGGHLLLAFVDVASDLGAALADKIEADISIVADDVVENWRRMVGTPSTVTSAKVEAWVRHHLLNGRRTPRIHPKVRHVLQVLREDLATSKDLSLRRMAAAAALSESRLMHVFSESVGAPLRTYILWLRLQSACGHIMAGASITAAAHRSGFSDAAHLTRTIRRMMGTTPGELSQRRTATHAVSISSG